LELLDVEKVPQKTAIDNTGSSYLKHVCSSCCPVLVKALEGVLSKATQFITGKWYRLNYLLTVSINAIM